MSEKRLAEITARWHNELPEAMRVLERGFTAATQFYAFPEPHWARLRTTNSLERLHTDIEPRLRRLLGYRHLPSLRAAIQKELGIIHPDSQTHAAA